MLSESPPLKDSYAFTVYIKLYRT